MATPGDILSQDAETFFVTLHNPAGATIAGPGVITGTINDQPTAVPVAADNE